MADIDFVGAPDNGGSFCFKTLVGEGNILTDAEIEMRDGVWPEAPLVELKNRVLNAVQGDVTLDMRVRSTTQYAYVTEMKAALFSASVKPAYGVLESQLCTHKQIVYVDNDLRSKYLDLEAVYASVQSLGIPAPYVTLIKTHIEGTSAYHRVAAYCALLLLVATVKSEL